MQRGAYGLVAWPSAKLGGWLRDLQAAHSVSGYGVPHLNLRAPFQTTLGRAELIEQSREALAGLEAFDVEIIGFKRYPSVVFLECRSTAPIMYAHLTALQIGPSSRSPYDGESYAPHLTVALGVLPWAEDEIWARLSAAELPVRSFTVEALSLTVEEQGEVLELHTFPLPLQDG